MKACYEHPRLSRRRASAALVRLAALVLVLLSCRAARSEEVPQTADRAVAVEGVTIPDTQLVDQDGRKIHFYTDLVRGKTVAINFVFTSCTTICPPLAATFSKLQGLLGPAVGTDVQLISVSVDPVTDTPPRLKAWSQKFHAGPGWTFVTGEKSKVDALLRALDAYTGRKEDHTPLVLIGNDAAGSWTRAYGLAPAQRLAEIIEAARKAPPHPARPADEAPAGSRGAADSPRSNAANAPVEDRSGPHPYFPDVELVSQDGKKLRFYSDLLEGKTVVINTFFTTCKGICPPMFLKLARIQESLGDQLGKDVRMLSVTVDPEHDTPPRLKEYAESHGAKPGWFFLGGRKEDVDAVLRKLGQYAESPDEHSGVLLIGNLRTGLWKKAQSLAATDDVIAVVQSVVNDR